MTATPTDTSKGFFISVATQALAFAHGYSKITDAYVARAEIAACLAELPEDMALRARLWPDLFTAQA